MLLDLDIRKKLSAGSQTFRLDVRLQTSSRRVVLLGPSGSGKSLTLKAIAGLLRPDEGHIRLAGRALFDAAERIDLRPQQRQLAYVFQDYALFPHLTVRQNIAFPLAGGWRNPGRAQRHAQAEHWCEAFQLGLVADQYPHELSGGQKQRTALARALVTQPQALLLDEPFAALDPALRALMRNELKALQQRLQVPMILITHDSQDAEVFGDHVLDMRDGRIVDRD
jgi:molybdate transport system ATP-binding protein